MVILDGRGTYACVQEFGGSLGNNVNSRISNLESLIPPLHFINKK